MIKIILLSLCTILLQACSQEYYTICMKYNEDNVFDTIWFLENKASELSESTWKTCYVDRNWATDIISCLWDRFYSINCK
jgi:hypothetical protein